MFTITNKLRTIVAVSVVGAALASTGVASAAIAVHPLGTVTTTVAAPPTVVYDMPGYPLDPGKVGSAGIPGYDNAACEGLAHDYNTANSHMDQAVVAGDMASAETYGALAQQIGTQIDNNCFVIE